MINNDCFSMLPNDLVQSTKDKHSICKIIKDSKVILILDYLYMNTTLRGISIFCLEDMIVELGFKPNNNKGRTNDKFKNILSKLIDFGIICELEKDIYPKKINYCKLKLNNNPSSDESDISGYFTLSDSEKIKILSLKDRDNVEILKLYCYLKSKSYKRLENKHVQRTSGRYEGCYPSYGVIENDLEISQNTITNYLKELKNLDLIRYDNNGLIHYKDDKSDIRESNNHYVLYDNNERWKDELRGALKYHKEELINSGCKFSKKKDNHKTNRKLNGLKGQYKKQLNNGKITQEEYDKNIEKINATINV